MSVFYHNISATINCCILQVFAEMSKRSQKLQVFFETVNYLRFVINWRTERICHSL